MAAPADKAAGGAGAEDSSDDEPEQLQYKVSASPLQAARHRVLTPHAPPRSARVLCR